MRLCVIPARGGSKRIPKKNIREFCGKPLIAWSIEVAIQSNCFDRIIVSTDDEEIASISKKYGAEVPFIRPKKLSDDYTVTADVVVHAIKWMNSTGQESSYVCCLYATAPFVQPFDLLRGFDALKDSDANYAFSVTSYAYPIQRALRVNKNQKIEMFQPKYLYTRSQDLEEALHDAGQFYWGKTSSWMENKEIFSNAVPVYIPRPRVQDLDTFEDLEIARLIAKVNQLKSE